MSQGITNAELLQRYERGQLSIRALAELVAMPPATVGRRLKTARAERERDDAAKAETRRVRDQERKRATRRATSSEQERALAIARDELGITEPEVLAAIETHPSVARAVIRESEASVVQACREHVAGSRAYSTAALADLVRRWSTAQALRESASKDDWITERRVSACADDLAVVAYYARPKTGSGAGISWQGSGVAPVPRLRNELLLEHATARSPL